jgi:hypothetical protein
LRRKASFTMAAKLGELIVPGGDWSGSLSAIRQALDALRLR